MSNPQQLRYSKEHEWLSAAEVGETVTAGESCGELESTKSVSDLYAPVTGEVVEANQDVVDDPSLVNSAPFEGGWLFKVRIEAEPEDLLSADEYTAFTAG
jgi:glycine cleavage system H protein